MRRGDPTRGPRRNRPSLTIRQAMGLVVYAAVACACAMPAVRLWENGIVDLPFLAVLVPPVIALAWAATTMVLVRRGRVRTRLVAGFVLFVVAVGLACTLRGLWSLAGAILEGRPLPPYGDWAITLLINVLAALTGLVVVLCRSLLRTARRDQAGGWPRSQ